MNDDYSFNLLLEKLLSYNGSNNRLIKFRDAVLEYYNDSDVSSTPLLLDSADLPTGHHGVGLCGGGKVLLGSENVEYTSTADGVKPYKVKGIPMKMGGRIISALLNSDNELTTDTNGISEEEELKLANVYIKENVLFNPKHSIQVDIDVVSNYIRTSHPELSNYISENANAFTPAFMGGNSLEDAMCVFVDDNDNFVVKNIKESLKADLRMVGYKSKDNSLYAYSFPISERVRITNSGCRMYPFNSVYNDEELFHLVNIAEGTRLGRKVARKASTGINKAVHAPVEFMRKLSDLDNKLRRAISDMRKARETKYKEQILNDEVLPIADEIFRLFIGAVVVSGLGFVAGPAGVLVGAGIALLINAILKINFKNKKEICIKILDDRIAQAESEIDDARSENDLETKRALEQVTRELKRKRDIIKKKGKLGARG